MVVSPDYEGLGAAVEAGVGSNLTQPSGISYNLKKKDKRKCQGVPQSQNAALPRPHEEEKTDKSKQAQIEQTYEKHKD